MLYSLRIVAGMRDLNRVFIEPEFHRALKNLLQYRKNSSLGKCAQSSVRHIKEGHVLRASGVPLRTFRCLVQ